MNGTSGFSIRMQHGGGSGQPISPMLLVEQSLIWLQHQLLLCGSLHTNVKMVAGRKQCRHGPAPVTAVAPGARLVEMGALLKALERRLLGAKSHLGRMDHGKTLVMRAQLCKMTPVVVE